MKTEVEGKFAVIVLVLCIFIIASIFFPVLGKIAGLLALMAMILGLVISNSTIRVMSIVLLSIGIIALIASWVQGAEIAFEESLYSLNQDPVAMIACITFLRLVISNNSSKKPKYEGRLAVLKTAFVAHILGSVINITSVGIIADKLQGRKELTLADAALLARSVSFGAFWSPFWVATAVAITLFPGTNLVIFIPAGLVMAIIMLLLSFVFNISKRDQEELKQYQGYSLAWNSLQIPLALFVMVLVIHLFLPEVSTPKIVVAASLLIALVAFLYRNGLGDIKTFFVKSLKNLPSSKNEITIFVAAGIVTIGTSVFQDTIQINLPFDEFSVVIAWWMILYMMLVSLFGIHPIVSLALFAGFIANLSPDPTLFTSAATIGWGLAVIVGPMSGVTNYLAGSYGISHLKLILSNIFPAVVGLLLSFLFLLVLQNLLL